jgi:tetratricopeptide (TPR) repeat protein
VHEDDALRAVRAADELRGGLGALNDELEASYGTRLELRIGVNTGEVVTGTEERLATGDAVNVAARLEQAAEPGEILLGEETCRLVRDAVDSQPADPIEAKGKAEPLQAYRLRSVRAELPARRHEAPMVGRERQRKLLEDAFAALSAERSCHLFTILGAAGVGKSRLVEEFLHGLADATVVRGRCLSYGEGISYWPVTEVVKQLAPTDDEAGALGAILGDEATASSAEEIAWSVRKLFESRAGNQALVIVFDDIHWGEPAFLDLVEHVADLSRGAPMLLLCMARPELLDRRPTWGGGKLNAANVLLEPLAPAEANTLIEALGDGLGEAFRTRILAAADGNPLFVEEMVAMATEEGGEIAIPPTIQALLAARLDQLEPPERSVLERGAIEGLVFHRGAVAALAPEETQVDGRLVRLVRKDLVRPEEPILAGDDAYRFRHLLIRDTAYDALPKAVRAELHERFAEWLEGHGTSLVELDEILGYHLEQAYRYRTELGPLDNTAAALGERAAKRLLASATRAYDRGDLAAAAGFFSRAMSLLPKGHPQLPWAELRLAEVVFDRGDFDDAGALLDGAETGARAANDERVLARAGLERIRQQTQKPTSLTGSLAEAKELLAVLERLGDEEGIVEALRLIGTLTFWVGSNSDALVHFRKAVERGSDANPHAASDALSWVLLSSAFGPTPVEETIRMCDEALASTSSKRLEAMALVVRGSSKACGGHLQEGRDEITAGRSLLLDLGDRMTWAGTSMMESETEMLAGSVERADEVLAESHKFLIESAETGYQSSVLSGRARAALEMGRDDDALRLADEAYELASPDDMEPHAVGHVVRARVLARRGDFEQAREELAAGAALIEPIDHVFLDLTLAFGRADLARCAGRARDEREALELALALCEAKGYTVLASRIREQLAED